MKSTLEVCSCGLAMSAHPKCQACGILIGPEHMERCGEKDKKSGRLICESCSWDEKHPPADPPLLLGEAELPLATRLQRGTTPIVPTPKERVCLGCNKLVVPAKGNYCPDCGEPLALRVDKNSLVR